MRTTTPSQPAVGVIADPSPERIKELISQLSSICIALYAADLRDPGVQIPLAALWHNTMFRRVYQHAKLGALSMASDRAEVLLGKLQ